MKEVYSAPVAGMIVFTAEEKLTTTGASKIPFNDEPATRLPSGGSTGLEDM